jgi:hypothetical protein
VVLLFFLIFIAALLLVVAGVFLITKKWAMAGVCLLSGLLFLSILVFLGAPAELPTGAPKTNIGAGEHKVAFVYVAGDNVSVGVEYPDIDKKDRLFLYQFNKKAFDGGMKKDARKLIVIESGDFKKLRLE